MEDFCILEHPDVTSMVRAGYPCGHHGVSERKKCAVCGRKADLHHIDRVGMGRDRDDICHEGLEALPLCREHHQEARTMPDSEFFGRYHLDRTLCRIWKLKAWRG